MNEYTNTCPFGASMLSAFRRMFSEKDIREILELSIPKEKPDDEEYPPNAGTPVIDAACCTADIICPQDIKLLNESRKKSEVMIDEICESEKRKRRNIRIYVSGMQLNFQKHQHLCSTCVSSLNKRDSAAVQDASNIKHRNKIC